MKNSNIKGYEGKVIFVGIDVHKNHYTVSCICEGELIKRDTITATPDNMVTYLQKYFRGAKVRSAYEAGFCGFYLHRYLVRHGIKNIVVHAASIEISARDRVKTDKRDSLKIAQQLAAGRLRGIHILDEQREKFRTITRVREQFMQQKKRVGNQLKSLCALYGFMSKDTRKVSHGWIKDVLELSMPEDIRYCVEMYAKEWLHLHTRLREILKKLSSQAQQDKSVNNTYCAVPGVGALSARILANELGDMSHFKNAKGLYSFTGLTPSEYSSGEHVRRGHISHQGRPILRRILVQVAWFAIKKDKALFQFFEQLSKRVGKKKAIVAVARKLIGRIRSCFITGELYILEKGIQAI